MLLNCCSADLLPEIHTVLTAKDAQTSVAHIQKPDMEVCCSAGAPVSVEYTPQGSVKELGGVQCYVTGSEAAQTAIVGIYDIFGFTSQV